MGSELRVIGACLLASIAAALSAQEAGADTTRSHTFIFASDTQEPMRVEEILLKSNENKLATEALFKEILAQEPTDIFLLGNVVNLGYKSGRWAFIDTALAHARARGFTVRAVLGNHELMGRAGRGERNFQSRFPEHVRTGYVVQKDGIAIVLLNSNFRKLSKDDVVAQDEWYTRTLAELDTASAVRTIIVCCHHSPYSDSRMVGSSLPVQEHFVQPFLNARKTSLFLSGHAHMYQHFVEGDKHFFVIGGGGGLHHPLRARTGPQVCLEPDYDPLFHYLTVGWQQGALHVISHRLKDDRTGFDQGCDYLIAMPAVPVTGSLDR